MGKRAGKVGTTLDYSTMYDNLKLELSGAPHDIKVEKLDQFYRRIVDTANHRLLEIERLSTKEGYEEIIQYGYRKAMYDIHDLFGEDRRRFKANALPIDDLRHAPKYINAVLRFLEMPTSTKIGVYDIYEKRANKVNKLYGTNVSWQTIANLYQSKLYSKLNAKLNASKTAVRVIGVLQKNKKELKEYFKNVDKAKKEGKDAPDIISIQVKDRELEDKVNEALKEYGKDISKLLKKI